jgi:hypothetical protein
MTRAALCLVVAAFLVAPAAAQDATPSSPPIAAALHSENSLRLLGLSPRDALSPAGIARASGLDLRSVDARVSERIGTAIRARTGTGILIGGVVGVAVGYFVGRGFIDSSDCSDCVARKFGAVGGGIIGAVIGRLVGSRSPRADQDNAAGEEG